MEITADIDLSPDELSRMEPHTFLNILQILMAELHLLRVDLDQPTSLAQSYRLTESILDEVRQGQLTPEQGLRLASVGFYFARELEEALLALADPDNVPQIMESGDNIRSIIDVLTVRLQEYFERQSNGNDWTAHKINQLTDNFMRFFAAVEKNSRGRYQIRFNVAARGRSDYLVNFKVEGPAGTDSLLMPPVMQDVFRDLIANARKYTSLGGSINAGLLQNHKELRMVVEDNGIGIPTDELNRVVEFGYRGKRSREHKTHGGGFGLTKAYVTTRQFGGRFWIESAAGEGTRIIIRIPLPQAP